MKSVISGFCAAFCIVLMCHSPSLARQSWGVSIENSFGGNVVYWDKKNTTILGTVLRPISLPPLSPTSGRVVSANANGVSVSSTLPTYPTLSIVSVPYAVKNQREMLQTLTTIVTTIPEKRVETLFRSFPGVLLEVLPSPSYSIRIYCPGDDFLPPPPPVEMRHVSPVNMMATASREEQYRIVIDNTVSGSIKVSTDQGQTWAPVGSVIHPINGVTHEIGDMEFTASDWALVGSVTATAVNAIHLKAAQLSVHAAVFSILPLEFLSDAPVTGSFRDDVTTIFTDIPAAHGIFGPPFAPRVGDPILVQQTPTSSFEPWPPGHALKTGERMMIIAQAPITPTWQIEIENRFGGNVTYFDGKTTMTIGMVYRPVAGVGRFGGTVFQDVGKIRANHPGVLCVSTSPVGTEGGFQIVPAFHCNSSNLTYVKNYPVYLVIGPVNARSKALEGTPPIFNGLIRPGDSVEVRIGGIWQSIPPAGGRDFTALQNVEAVRIYPAAQGQFYK